MIKAAPTFPRADDDGGAGAPAMLCFLSGRDCQPKTSREVEDEALKRRAPVTVLRVTLPASVSGVFFLKRRP